MAKCGFREERTFKQMPEEREAESSKENWGECSRERSHEYKGLKEGISLGRSRNQKKASAVKV